MKAHSQATVIQPGEEMAETRSRSNATEEAGFILHPRLADDLIPLADLPLCHVGLMRNAAFPWLVLVPRRAGAVEIHRLSPSDRAALMEEVATVASALEAVTTPDKINIGALGNLVPQLHVHIVARRRDDPAWPGPVWGSPHHQDYAPGEAEALVAELRQRLGR